MQQGKYASDESREKHDKFVCVFGRYIEKSKATIASTSEEEARMMWHYKLGHMSK